MTREEETRGFISRDIKKATTWNIVSRKSITSSKTARHSYFILRHLPSLHALHVRFSHDITSDGRAHSSGPPSRMSATMTRAAGRFYYAARLWPFFSRIQAARLCWDVAFLFFSPGKDGRGIIRFDIAYLKFRFAIISFSFEMFTHRRFSMGNGRIVISWRISACLSIYFASFLDADDSCRVFICLSHDAAV